MSTQHSSLDGNSLHENKGAADAANNEVATVTASNTVWKKLTHLNLTGTGNPFGGQLLHVIDEKNENADGGSVTSGGWRDRDLNTVLTNEISGASLAGNKITLPSGTYMVMAKAPAYRVEKHKTRLWNHTNSTVLIKGSSEKAGDNTDSSMSTSTVWGRFTLGGTKDIKLQHRVETNRDADGFGLAGGFNQKEVYSEVMIWKVA